VRAVAGPRPTALALLCAALARCCDATLLWSATHAAGLHLSLPASALAFGIAGLTGGFSLLPAGVGAVEASLVATISGLGGDPAAALMAALLARCVTLWIWIPVGLWFALRATTASNRGPVAPRPLRPVVVDAALPVEQRVS
jgi:putative heme transporter